MNQYQKLLNMLGQSGAQQQEISKEAANNDGTTNACFAGKFCLSAHSKTGWVLDSGATDHVCHDLSLLQSSR